MPTAIQPSPPISVKRTLDDTIEIINPIHRGAAIDWKATAHALAEQLDLTLTTSVQDARTFRTAHERYDRAFRAVEQAHGHWTFHLLPKWLKDSYVRLLTS